ncbi:DUF881 domain-containing protein [Bifidobacterium aquikefiricola]|uniref:DUF881 domain-containing protein n=1 Tax=Bifidobacterium aquikefiricola TaxID=3059038 RepID=A0AB39U7A6_9BIFI
MAQRTGKHQVHHSLPGMVAVAVIFALTGYLLITNIRVNRSVTVTSDTAGLVEERVDKVNSLSAQVSRLSSRINSLKSSTSETGKGESEDPGSSTVLPAVKGPGVTVTLDDSPLWEQKLDESGSSATINDYVVHQQDLEAVINALWAGGAESMEIQNQRILPTTAVRCVGNVLLIQGKKFSPPYTVSAIGPTQSMIEALDDSPTIQIYQQYVNSIGLGWKVETPESLTFPKATAVLQPLQYAKVDEKAKANE